MSSTSPASLGQPRAARDTGLMRRDIPKYLLLIAAFYFLFFHGLAGVGLLGPDEPRYAAIGREMARSGDWVTPRLWGEPWFEKPALTYWMTGIGFLAGLGDDLAPRLPVAILSAAFLIFYYRVLQREFGSRAAFFSSAILGASAGWLAFSRVGVTDLPLAATFSAAMLLCLPNAADDSRRMPPAAGALLGAAVLAKGLVPLVLALPLAWILLRRHGWRWKTLRPYPAIAAFLLTAAPWYVLCTMANGTRFPDDFFLKHHFGRFASEALQHEQPYWFYLPVLLAGLFPWTPAIVLLFQKRLYCDARRRFLLLWFAFGFLFFSASINKLPGYLLPLMPALAALLGLGLAESKRARWILAACALLLALLPVIADVLPDALMRGITKASFTLTWWPLVPAVALAAAVWISELKGRRELAVASLVAAMAVGVVWLQAKTFTTLDRTVSARHAWRSVAGMRGEVCLEPINRSLVYNLNYYSVQPLPDCAESPRRFRLRQDRGGIAAGDEPPMASGHPGQ